MTEPQRPNPASSDQNSSQPDESRRSIKIGSQRERSSDAKPTSDWSPSTAPRIAKTPTEAPDANASSAEPQGDSSSVGSPETGETSTGKDSADMTRHATQDVTQDAGDAESPVDASPADTTPTSEPTVEAPTPATASDETERRSAEEMFPAPAIQRISADLQAEIDAALSDISVDDLMGAQASGGTAASQTVELDQRYPARVIKCDRESVFVSFGGHHEGAAPRRQFDELPEAGAELEVIPVRYLAEDNLYEVHIPGASIDVQDWSDLSEGVAVEAKISGQNKGGLECEVNRIPGFIPISQISLYRVEDLEPYVGQTLQCVVTECNPDRRNLVLSHRAVLEREREHAREKLLEELEVGQIRDGVVRSLQPFGAFVDLGGVDGLIHVSALSWDRVAHPSEVLETGQRVKVRVDKIDPNSQRIGLSYRDVLENPWESAESKFGVGSIVRGTVSKIMDFGAFIRLAAGVEGLVHISEIAHHRVHKVAAFLKPGQEVDVKVLSIDPANQRMSLSIKAAQAMASAASAADIEEDESETEAPTPSIPARNEPLKGGLNRGSGGDQFGLNW